MRQPNCLLCFAFVQSDGSLGNAVQKTQRVKNTSVVTAALQLVSDPSLVTGKLHWLQWKQIASKSPAVFSRLHYCRRLL